jgi:hypothetical protein
MLETRSTSEPEEKMNHDMDNPNSPHTIHIATTAEKDLQIERKNELAVWF